ncbi:hypothetical protein BD311DRAFT_115726 [Dichomitus squalens]|uniref:Uncharacterized protein n=1 Tax=Dichomitus squalens TaxID=114155 RepID=A0A4Q9MU24_9APHY|nr:hypothetical protein BD311DRAFT_115726 [Dichomitus squalens]
MGLGTCARPETTRPGREASRPNGGASRSSRFRPAAACQAFDVSRVDACSSDSKFIGRPCLLPGTFGRDERRRKTHRLWSRQRSQYDGLVRRAMHVQGGYYSRSCRASLMLTSPVPADVREYMNVEGNTDMRSNVHVMPRVYRYLRITTSTSRSFN